MLNFFYLISFLREGACPHVKFAFWRSLRQKKTIKTLKTELVFWYDIPICQIRVYNSYQCHSRTLIASPYILVFLEQLLLLMLLSLLVWTVRRLKKDRTVLRKKNLGRSIMKIKISKLIAQFGNSCGLLTIMTVMLFLG